MYVHNALQEKSYLETNI